MFVRPEGPDDVAAIRKVHAAAFAEGDAQPEEVRLVDELRASPDVWLPHLSLVAELDGEVVGHVVCTRATLMPAELAVLALAPIGVVPRHQRRGVGGALMRAVLGAADACGEPLVGLVGDPAYYERFGFVPGRHHGIELQAHGLADYFQVRTLTAFPAGMAGWFHYAAPFGLT